LIKSKKGETCQKPSKFDEKCQEKDIEHRLIKPRTPKTNGMVERVNHTIKQAIFKTQHFDNVEDMNVNLLEFLQFYNLHRRHSSLQKELRIRTPFQALEIWYHTNPELFIFSPQIFKQNLLLLKNIYSITCMT
jgi:transposase InsO family protein